jgi:hypothetical protein
MRTLPEMGEIFILTSAAHLYLQAFVNFASHLLRFQWFYGSMGVWMIGYEIVMSNQGAIHDREQKLPNTKTSGIFYVESYLAPLWMSRNICLLD